MGIKRIVDTAFWTDGKVDEFSPEDKYFMLYLLTNPFSKQLGIYEISIKQAAFQLGYSMDAVKVLIDRFENKYKMIMFSNETNEIAIINFLRHSVMKGGKPVEDCIRKEMTLVKNKKLIEEVFLHLSGKDGLNETVKKIVDSYIKENEIQKKNEKDNEIHNDNDNDNERTDGESYHDSYHDSLKQPAKHKYGKLNNVLLTEDEFTGLVNDYGIDLLQKAISFLDLYIKEKRYESDSHDAAIRRWVIKAVKDRERKTQQQNNNRNGGNVFLAMLNNES